MAENKGLQEKRKTQIGNSMKTSMDITVDGAVCLGVRDKEGARLEKQCNFCVVEIEAHGPLIGSRQRL